MEVWQSVYDETSLMRDAALQLCPCKKRQRASDANGFRAILEENFATYSQQLLGRISARTRIGALLSTAYASFSLISLNIPRTR